MSRLIDDPQVTTRIEEILVANYGRRLQDGLLDEVQARLGHLAADLVKEAVLRHVADTTLISEHERQPLGHFPPSVAQLLVWVGRLEVERQRQTREQYRRQQDELARRQGTPVAVPEEVQARYALPAQVHRYEPSCRDCGDSGMARFWFDPASERRVWDEAEYLGLPRPEQARLRIGQALCTCSRGMARPERGWKTTVRYQGRERSVSVVPLMEVIRSLAARRRQEEVRV